MSQVFSNPVTRRRALFIGAVLVAGAALPSAMLAPRAFAAKPVRWSGQALGAHAEIELIGANEAEAKPVLAAVEAEIARLESVFSLYRQDSALSRLNRDGLLNDPPPELLEVLALSRPSTTRPAVCSIQPSSHCSPSTPRGSPRPIAPVCPRSTNSRRSSPGSVWTRSLLTMLASPTRKPAWR